MLCLPDELWVPPQPVPAPCKVLGVSCDAWRLYSGCTCCWVSRVGVRLHDPGPHGGSSARWGWVTPGQRILMRCPGLEGDGSFFPMLWITQWLYTKPNCSHSSCFYALPFFLIIAVDVGEGKRGCSAAESSAITLQRCVTTGTSSPSSCFPSTVSAHVPSTSSQSL